MRVVCFLFDGDSLKDSCVACDDVDALKKSDLRSDGSSYLGRRPGRSSRRIIPQLHMIVECQIIARNGKVVDALERAEQWSRREKGMEGETEAAQN